MLQAIDVFLSEARDSLSVRPQTVEEIGQVNIRHAELAKKKPEVCVQPSDMYGLKSVKFSSLTACFLDFRVIIF